MNTIYPLPLHLYTHFLNTLHFFLVEFIISLLVILLASTIFIAYGNAILQQTKLSEGISLGAALRTELVLHYAQTGQLPADAQALNSFKQETKYIQAITYQDHLITLQMNDKPLYLLPALFQNNPHSPLRMLCGDVAKASGWKPLAELPSPLIAQHHSLASCY